MVTFVGNEDDFVAALKNLIELDYDAVEAYEKAIERIQNRAYRKILEEFKADHERHIQELSDLLKSKDEEAPKGPSTKKWLTKGKVVLATLMGDEAILAAMRSNEEDTNQAYNRMVDHPGKWEDAKDILDQGLADEKRHKAWLDGIAAE